MEGESPIFTGVPGRPVNVASTAEIPRRVERCPAESFHANDHRHIRRQQRERFFDELITIVFFIESKGAVS